MTDTDLQIMPERMAEEYRDITGIYVRAKTPEGRWVNADIAQLTKGSLLDWLRGKDASEQVFLILLGHPR